MHIQLAAAARAGKKASKGGIVKCGFGSHIPPFSLCQLGQKQIIRRKCVWDCLVLWLLLLAEAVAQTLIQRESCLLQGERTALRAAGMSIASGVLLHWRD